MIITFDGPTASGKSTVAGAIAQTLGYYHLNSGLLYRSLAYLLVTKFGYSVTDLETIKEEDIRSCMNSAVFSYSYDAGETIIAYQGKEITPFLKDATVDHYVTLISGQKAVRDAMLAKQHELASIYNIVTDGRDVGSHVFPNADYKFYLTATLPVRAERWRLDQEARGNSFTVAEAEVRVQERDKQDQNRIISPLVVPQGAITIDSTLLNFEEVVAKVLLYVQK